MADYTNIMKDGSISAGQSQMNTNAHKYTHHIQLQGHNKAWANHAYNSDHNDGLKGTFDSIINISYNLNIFKTFFN